MKCQHCGKDCLKRVAVRSKGKVLMVGSACSKRFKRARTKDLLRDASLSDAIAKRVMSHGGDPSKFEISKDDFRTRFRYEPDLNGIEFYNWNGYGVTLVRDIRTTRDKLKLQIYDPYSSKRGTEQVAELIYEDVSKAKTPGKKLSVAPGYEYNVIGIKDPPSDINDPLKGKILEWVDEFELWDPIKKYGLESKYDAVPASSIYSYKKSLIPTASLPVATPILPAKTFYKSFLKKKLKHYREFNEDNSYVECEIQAVKSDYENCNFENCDLEFSGVNISCNLPKLDVGLRPIILSEFDNLRYSTIKNCLLSFCDFVKIKSNDFLPNYIQSSIDNSYIHKINAQKVSFDGYKFYSSKFLGDNNFLHVIFNEGVFLEVSCEKDNNIVKNILKNINWISNDSVVNFEDCTFLNFHFNDCDLSRFKFIKCRFQDCVFINCKLGQRGSAPSATVLERTVMKDCLFNRTDLPSSWKIDPLTGIVES